MCSVCPYFSVEYTADQQCQFNYEVGLLKSGTSPSTSRWQKLLFDHSFRGCQYEHGSAFRNQSLSRLHCTLTVDYDDCQINRRNSPIEVVNGLSRELCGFKYQLREERLDTELYTFGLTEFRNNFKLAQIIKIVCT